jgi:3-hydroxyisobutyrate dehydrogenase-like beta-hydroxyacid dehydrogenase
LAIASEAMVVGSKAGLDLSAMLDVLNHGSGQNSATLTKIPKAVLPRTFNHGASLAVLLKDLRAFLHEAGSLGVPTPIGDAVVRAYEGAVETEGADADITHIVRAIERRAGWDMPQVVP